jgi:hypothetical protein
MRRELRCSIEARYADVWLHERGGKNKENLYKALERDRMLIESRAEKVRKVAISRPSGLPARLMFAVLAA